MISKNDLASAISEYSQTLTSKLLMVTGGTSAYSQTSYGEWLKNLISDFVTWPWMETLSYVAIIMLIIERGFILWSWYNRHKRGEI